MDGVCCIIPNTEPAPTPNIDNLLGVMISFSFSETSRGGVARTEDLALGGEKSVSGVCPATALLILLGGGRFSLTKSVESIDSASEPSCAQSSITVDAEEDGD